MASKHYINIQKPINITQNPNSRKESPNPDLGLQKIEEQRSGRAEKLGDVGLGVGVHANNDDHRNESVVGDDLGLLHGPGAPLLEALCHGFLIFSSYKPLEPLPLTLPFFFSVSLLSVGGIFSSFLHVMID